MRLFLTDQATDGRVMKVRGKIINPYRDPIEGIRLIYLDIAPGDPPRVLGSSLRILGTKIDPGQSAPLRWDVQSMYLGSSPSRFQILAFAIHRGGQALPLPPGWEAGDDDKARAADQ